MHPPDGTLHTLLEDRGIWSRVRERLHLLRCASCRQRLTALRRQHDEVAALLGTTGSPVDVPAAWARIGVRVGRARSPGRRVPLRAAAAVVAVVFALLILSTLRSVAPRPDTGALLGLVREARASASHELVRDVCCEDHDGGDIPDDGLLTVSRPGERVLLVIVYEDVDHSGTFSPGDIVRYVSISP